MEIYVNEHVLDAEMAGEKNLAEVYEAINRWSADNKKYILNLRVDSQDVPIRSLEDFSTDSVNRVDFYIGDELDMVLSTLEETDRYVDQIGEILFGRDRLTKEDLGNLLEGVHWMRKIMGSISGILHLDLSEMHSPLVAQEKTPENSVEACLGAMEAAVSTLEASLLEEKSERPAIESFLNELRSFKLFVMGLSTQLESMNAGREELVEALEEFEARIPEITELIISINEGFNTGKDLESLEKLEGLTEGLNQYISALFALDWQLKQNEEAGFAEIELEGVPFQDRSADLTALLRDLSDALEENDIVAVGDILEYELTEKLEQIRPYLKEICSKK